MSYIHLSEMIEPLKSHLDFDNNLLPITNQCTIQEITTKDSTAKWVVDTSYVTWGTH